MGASVSPAKLLGHLVLRRVDALVQWDALNQLGKLGTTEVRTLRDEEDLQEIIEDDLNREQPPHERLVHAKCRKYLDPAAPEEAQITIAARQPSASGSPTAAGAGSWFATKV